MFWIDVNKAIPASNKQVVKVKVADYVGYHVTYAHYSHSLKIWISEDGRFLNDNVYKWKHVRKRKK